MPPFVGIVPSDINLWFKVQCPYERIQEIHFFLFTVKMDKKISFNILASLQDLSKLREKTGLSEETEIYEKYQAIIDMIPLLQSLNVKTWDNHTISIKDNFHV